MYLFIAARPTFGRALSASHCVNVARTRRFLSRFSRNKTIGTVSSSEEPSQKWFDDKGDKQEHVRKAYRSKEYDPALKRRIVSRLVRYSAIDALQVTPSSINVVPTVSAALEEIAASDYKSRAVDYLAAALRLNPHWLSVGIIADVAKALIKSKDFVMAERLLAIIASDHAFYQRFLHFRLTSVWGSLIQARAHLNDIESVSRLISLAGQFSVFLSTETLRCLLALYARFGRVQLAEALFAQLQTITGGCSSKTYITMMDMYNLENMHEKTLEIFQKMQTLNVPYGANTEEPVLRSYCILSALFKEKAKTTQDHEKSNELWKKAQQLVSLDSTTTLTSESAVIFFDALVRSKQFPQAIQFYENFLKQIHTYPSNFKTFLDHIVSSGHVGFTMKFIRAKPSETSPPVALDEPESIIALRTLSHSKNIQAFETHLHEHKAELKEFAQSQPLAFAKFVASLWKNPHKASEILQSVRVEGAKFQLSDLLRKLTSANLVMEGNNIISLAKTLGETVSSTANAELIIALSNNNLCRDSDIMFDNYVRDKVFDEASLEMLLSFFGKSRRKDRMLQLLDAYKTLISTSEEPPNNFLISRVIMTLCENTMFTDVEEIWEALGKRLDFRPDLALYSTVVMAYTHALQLDKAFDLATRAVEAALAGQFRLDSKFCSMIVSTIMNPEISWVYKQERMRYRFEFNRAVRSGQKASSVNSREFHDSIQTLPHMAEVLERLHPRIRNWVHLSARAGQMLEKDELAKFAATLRWWKSGMD